MKWIYRIQHKARPALLLMVVVVMILACSFQEKAFFRELDNSVSSLYRDRLIPEAELFRINDLMHSRRLLLEKYLLVPTAYQTGVVHQQLKQKQAQIDVLLRTYETSYMATDERAILTDFKHRLQQYRGLEEELLATACPVACPEAYEAQLAPVFQDLHHGLQQLSSIQTSVGKQLYNGSHTVRASASLLSYLQIGVVIVIMLAVQALLLSSKSLVPKKFQDFRWN